MENRELRQKISLLNVPGISPEQTSGLHGTGPAMSASHGTMVGIGNLRSNIEDDWNGVKDETFINSRYSGETSCLRFSGYLRQVLTSNNNPPPVGPHHYHKHQSLNRLTSTHYKLPPYRDAKMLVDVVLRFM